MRCSFFYVRYIHITLQLISSGVTFHEYVLNPRFTGDRTATAAAGSQDGQQSDQARCPLGQSHLADDRNCHVFYHCVRTYWGLHMTRKSCGQYLMFNQGSYLD